MQKRKVLTLLLIQQTNKILLGMKKRGFGAGRWNGFGGKVETGQTILEAAVRETVEQSGVKPLNVKKLATIDFEFQNDPVILQVHLFKSKQFEGSIVQSEEMKPEWFDVDKVPFDKMWPDDIHWFPYMLQDKPFKAYFLFQGHDRIIKHTIQQA